MRIALLSDVHANLPACEAVLEDMATREVDRVLCLGDMVGYGPKPVEVLARLRATGARMIMGNHDAAVCKLMPYDDFRDRARQVVDWTRDQLDPTDLALLAELPYVLDGEAYQCAHCDVVEPAAFYYLENETDARANWSAGSSPLLFVGHTHVPAIHILDGDQRYHCLPAQGIHLQPDERYIVNVGSVGFSRDDDYRAPYVLFDTDLGALTWVRVPYDLDRLARDCEEAFGDGDEVPVLQRKRDLLGPGEDRVEVFAPTSLRRPAPAPPVVRTANRLLWLVGMPLLLLVLLVVGVVVASRTGGLTRPSAQDDLVERPAVPPPAPSSLPAPLTDPTYVPPDRIEPSPSPTPTPDQAAPERAPRPEAPRYPPGTVTEGFETDLGGWEASARDGVELSSTALTVHSGERALRLLKSPATTELAQVEVLHRFPPGRGFTVTFHALHQGPPPAGRLRVLMAEREPAGATQVLLGQVTLQSGNWMPFRAEYRPSLDAPLESLRLILRYPEEGADILVDDLALIPL